MGRNWQVHPTEKSSGLKLGPRRSQLNPPEIQIDYAGESDSHALSALINDRTFYYAFKRLLDITVTALAFIILAPAMAMIAVVIVLDSGRPVIFRQERVGSRRRKRDGSSYWQHSRFSFYKFRTMIQDADPALHQAFTQAFINNDANRMATMQGEDRKISKLKSDPRITRVGKLLRRSSLDELPQLWNIIKGDMSLVGPRPPIPYEVDEYKRWHRQRLLTKPGLTGLWQVCARSSVDFDEMVRLDIKYIEHQSIWVDIKIMLKTPLVVLLGKGAV